MERVAHRVVLAWGASRALMALAAGAVGALAMPPFGILPALAVSMTVVVWLLDGSPAAPGRWTWPTVRSAAMAGWCFGFGYFVAGLWWLGAAFLVEPDQFALLMPLGVVGLPAALAIFPALGFVLARLLWSPGPWRVLALAAGLGMSEWLRGHLFTGFPWNSYGMALGDHLLLAQAASLVGVEGLTPIAIAICAAPATLASGEGRARWMSTAVARAALGIIASFGAVRLGLGSAGDVAGVRLRIVQPNVAQDDKFRAENGPGILRKYLEMSDRATSPERTGVADVTHLVWPESAFPFVLAREPAALAQIAEFLPPSTTLVTGAVRMIDPLPGEAGRRFFNAIQVVGHDGTVLGSADKVHLVPFGEYLPLSSLLTTLGLRQFVNAPGGFEAGVRRKLLDVPGLPPVAPLVCYEAIFPGDVTPADGSAGLLLNVTNDAWFGMTPGPWQHFAQARLRTIEEGLPLVRAANNGVSAVVDPYGRLVASLALGVEGVLDSALPSAIAPPPYARHPWLSAVLLTFFCLSAAIGSRRV